RDVGRADRGGDQGGDGVRILRRQLGGDVRGEGRVRGGAVDRAHIGTDDLVEQSLATHRLAGGARGGGREHARQPDLADGELHGGGVAQPDARRGAADE